MTTIREAWRSGRAQLDPISTSPALDARLLLAHVLGRDHAYLIAHDADALTAAQQTAYQALIARAAAHEPVPYLLGRAPFMGLEFTVSHDVLIPRPETEHLVEMAIRWAKGRGAIRAVDVGTGSGCIAISMAYYLPKAEVIAIDISSGALSIARANAARHAPGRVHFVQADLLSAVAPGIDLLVANLPYIARREWPTLPIGVKSYEPEIALDGGPDGLDPFKIMLPQAAERLKPGGLALLEIGWQQGETVAALAGESFPDAAVTVHKDFAGHNRIVAIQANG